MFLTSHSWQHTFIYNVDIGEEGSLWCSLHTDRQSCCCLLGLVSRTPVSSSLAVGPLITGVNTECQWTCLFWIDLVWTLDADRLSPRPDFVLSSWSTCRFRSASFTHDDSASPIRIAASVSLSDCLFHFVVLSTDQRAAISNDSVFCWHVVESPSSALIVAL